MVKSNKGAKVEAETTKQELEVVEKINNKKEEIIVEAPKQKKKFSFRFIVSFIKVIFIAFIILATLVIALQHPIIKEKYSEFFNANERKEIERLNEELDALKATLEKGIANKNTIFEIGDNLDLLKEKYAVLEELNLNAIRSKADVSLVLGVIGRLDNIENKVNDVAKVSDRGALIAMATNLVKDAAESGRDFTYEISILEQLTKDEPRAKMYVDILSKYSNQAIYNEAFLKSEFEKIYKNTLKDDEENLDETDWRVKFNKKFGKIVTIKYRKVEEGDDKEVNLDRAMYFIDKGEFVRAVDELNRSQYASVIDGNEELKTWLNYANGRLEFTNALSRISAFSLAAMKVNELTK